MKKIFKILIVLIFVSFVMPQIALASWWNPFSWSIWNIFKPQTVTTVPTTPNTPEKIDIYNLQQSNQNNAPTTGKNSKQQNPSIKTQPMGGGGGGVGTQPTVPTQPPNSILCNGTYYTKCSLGADFVCPISGGSAYCQLQQPNTANSPIPTPTPQQGDSNLTIAQCQANAQSQKDICTQKAYQMVEDTFSPLITQAQNAINTAQQQINNVISAPQTPGLSYSQQQSIIQSQTSVYQTEINQDESVLANDQTLLQQGKNKADTLCEQYYDQAYTACLSK